MSLTRRMLKEMGLEDENIEKIIEAHTDTVDALKNERDNYKKDVEKLKEVESELSKLKENGGDTWEEKYNTLKNDFEKYKDDFEKYKLEIEEKESTARKEKSARAYFESKNITGKNLEIAIRGSKQEIKELELDGDKIKDTTKLDDLINGDFSGLVGTLKTAGASTPNPPTGGGSSILRDKREIMKIKDTAERQRALAQYIAENRKGELINGG